LTDSLRMQSENFTAPDAAFAAASNISWIDSVHGHSGPVQSTYANYVYPGVSTCPGRVIRRFIK
jgi:hypothetical protein